MHPTTDQLATFGQLILDHDLAIAAKAGDVAAELRGPMSLTMTPELIALPKAVQQAVLDKIDELATEAGIGRTEA